MSYTRVGGISEAVREFLLKRIERAQWSPSKGETRDYWAIVDGPRMYVKICPGGYVHPHQDHGMKTHIVLQTDGAVSWCDGKEYRLEQGGIYLMDASKEHWSENAGSIDRIHLVLS